ncbi:MAG TPA: glycosyltransferase family 2 protein [Puia sp.]|nr:glycosyltransferase family 2 protein [Puia sp.]
MSDTLISVVIPVKNGDAWLGRTIPAVLGQRIPGNLEIIVIDSGSTDNSLRILDEYPVRVHHLPPEDFNHGTTRNLGVSLARGKYVVMTVQDATPSGDGWLQSLLDGFDEDKVAAVCGLQIVPHDRDKNPIAWFRPVDPPGTKKYSFPSAAGFDALSPTEKRTVCRWDNVNAMYRKDILERLPFRKTEFAEDALWAADALRAGYSLVYQTAARVFHYHYETPGFTLRRSFAEYYHYYKIFGTIPDKPAGEWIQVLRNIRVLLKENSIGWRQKWDWLGYNRRQRKAIGKSIGSFRTALAKGERQLDEMYDRLCTTPPQAVKPASKTTPE